VRPINLIPTEQRRGAAARGPGARPSVAGYAVLGVLGAAVLCVLAVVVTSNQINSKQEKLAKIQTQSQSEKQVADALRPYGQFADIQRARVTQINTLAASRFNWERPLRQLALALPRNVWLLTVAATGSPDVEVDSGGSGGDISNLRDKSTAPAFAITGCTYSQHAVARMMTRMRNLDDVTGVHLAKSARREATDQGGGTAVAASGEGSAASEQEVGDCTGSARVTKFDILVEFGGAAVAAGATPGADAGVPAGSAAPVADANAAAAQGTQASAAAGGTP
jgi:Tfp pilus assembly protein PilN